MGVGTPKPQGLPLSVFLVWNYLSTVQASHVCPTKHCVQALCPNTRKEIELDMLCLFWSLHNAVAYCLTGAAHAETEDQMQAWKCMESSVAISMLVKACQSLHTLESLIVRFTHVGTCHQTVRNQVPRKDPFQDISRIYAPVWFDLQGLLKSSLSLR